MSRTQPAAARPTASLPAIWLPAIWVAALMRVPAVYVLTYEPAGTGGDGHAGQPVTELAALRAIPGVAVIRPAGPDETAQAWQVARERTDGPTVLVLSCREQRTLSAYTPLGVSWAAPLALAWCGPAGRVIANATARGRDGFVARVGARVVREGGWRPEVVLVASGSEVPLAVAAADLLLADGVAARVVSVPWRERFLASACRDVMLPPGVPRVVIEAASPDGWRALAGPAGEVIGLRRSVTAPGTEGTVGPCFSADGIRAVAHDVILAAAHAPW